MTASEFQLTIRRVYPTTNWEDTALSEIRFEYEGRPIPVDLCEYEQYL